MNVNYLSVRAEGTGSSLLDGLVAYWKLDDSGSPLQDAHTGNHDLTNYGASLNQGSAKLGTCVTFAGDDYLDGGDTTFEITSAITVSCWVKATGTFADFSGLVTNYYWTGDGFALLINTARYPDWAVYNHDMTPDNAEITAAAEIGSGVWAHLVGTFDGTTLRLYVDSVIDETTVTWNHPISYDANSILTIGSRGDGLFLTGSIDEVGIWNRALTQTEINELYNSGSGRTYPFS